MVEDEKYAKLLTNKLAEFRKHGQELRIIAKYKDTFGRVKLEYNIYMKVLSRLKQLPVKTTVSDRHEMESLHIIHNGVITGSLIIELFV